LQTISFMTSLTKRFLMQFFNNSFLCFSTKRLRLSAFFCFKQIQFKNTSKNRIFFLALQNEVYSRNINFKWSWFLLKTQEK
jgi:hypothetical protein